MISQINAHKLTLYQLDINNKLNKKNETCKPHYINPIIIIITT